MTRRMTRAEAYDFLAYGRRTGKLATVRKDGSPHVAPIWFVIDGDDLVFTTGADTVKGKTLRRDPRAALSVDLEEPPFSFVLVEGTVTVHDDPDTALRPAIEIARRYMGEELAESYGRRNAVPGELLIRLHPTKLVALADIAE